MTTEARPILPDIPDVVPYEDEAAKRVLREWAEAFAVQCECYTARKYLRQLERAKDDASRLRYPDTAGS